MMHCRYRSAWNQLWTIGLLMIFAACGRYESQQHAVGAIDSTAKIELDKRKSASDTLPAPRYDRVVRIIDGDTIELQKLGKVRLLGINTPETVDPRQPVQAFGREASRYTKDHLLGEKVRLEYEYPRQDHRGRVLAYVYLDDTTNFNAMIVRDGYAYTYSDYPFAYVEEFLALQREAREKGRGLWGDASVTDIPDYVFPRTKTPSSTTAKIVELTSPVKPGHEARIVVQTEPRVRCAVQLLYASGPSSSRDLSPKSSGPNGTVSWKWLVGSRTEAGDYPIRVSCNKGYPVSATFSIEG